MAEHTKRSVETIPFGEHAVSFLESSYWQQADVRAGFQATLGGLMHELGVERQLGACLVLRLIVFAHDFSREVQRWQSQLGLPVGITRDDYGLAAGKSFVWGDGEPKSTYAVIVIPEGAGAALLAKAPVAIGLFVLEMAHVYDAVYLLKDIGPIPHPDSNDLAGLRFYIAVHCWTGFFTRSVAYNYLPGKELQSNIELSLEMLKNAIEESALELASYRFHRNAGHLWVKILTSISRVFSQVGRTLGESMAAGKNGTKMRHAFFHAVRELSADWHGVITKIELGCLQVEKLKCFKRAEFTTLEATVDSAFAASGIKPLQTSPDQGVWIEVL